MKTKRKLVFYSFLMAGIILILSACMNMHISYKMRGTSPTGNEWYVPYDYFAKYKGENERMLYAANILTPEHWQGYLFVITNPEYIQKAKDNITALGNLDAVAFNTLQKAIAEFSPVRVRSSNDTALLTSIVEGNGIGVFHIPESTSEIFYAYLGYKADANGKNSLYTSDYITKVRFDSVPLPAGKSDIFISFSELNTQDKMQISTQTEAAKNKELYSSITGLYAEYIANKPDAFIDVNWKEIWEAQTIIITPPPKNIVAPEKRERYTIPISPSLVGEYAKYKVTARDIVGKSAPWELSKDQILEWIALNKDNQDFQNALAICMIIADKYDYNAVDTTKLLFVCVDYCAMFVGIDADANNGGLSSKIRLLVDKDHIWMELHIPNKYKDASGAVKEASYLWVDPTWFDNDAYNFNFFTWGGDYVPQFMEGGSGDHQCHKELKRIAWEERNYNVPGLTYSVVFIGGRYYCVQDNFGRKPKV